MNYPFGRIKYITKYHGSYVRPLSQVYLTIYIKKEKALLLPRTKPSQWKRTFS